MSIKLMIQFKDDCQTMSLDHLIESLMESLRDAVRQEVQRALSAGKLPSQTPKDSDQTHPVALSKARAAKALGISVRTLDYCIAQKKIRILRIGRRVLVPMTSIEAATKRGALNIRHDRAPVAQSEALWVQET
jgi:excisionase family DNA binding protein